MGNDVSIISVANSECQILGLVAIAVMGNAGIALGRAVRAVPCAKGLEKCKQVAYVPNKSQGV